MRPSYALVPPCSDWNLAHQFDGKGIPNAREIDYSWVCAVVVVEGATLATFVTGPITMLAIGILLNIIGLGILCWALFALAIYALPFFVGMTVGICSFQAGAGPLGAILVGFVTSGFTLAVGRYAFSVTRAPIFRLLIGLLFAASAARAGYDATLALSHFVLSEEWWRQSFALFGAIAVGSTAWARVSILTEPTLRSGGVFGPTQPPLGQTTKRG